jgi:hypothetical protein
VIFINGSSMNIAITHEIARYNGETVFRDWVLFKKLRIQIVPMHPFREEFLNSTTTIKPLSLPSAIPFL